MEARQGYQRHFTHNTGSSQLPQAITFSGTGASVVRLRRTQEAMPTLLWFGLNIGNHTGAINSGIKLAHVNHGLPGTFFMQFSHDIQRNTMAFGYFQHSLLSIVPYRQQ